MEEPSQPLQAAVVQFAHLELANSEIDEARVKRPSSHVTRQRAVPRPPPLPQASSDSLPEP